MQKYHKGRSKPVVVSMEGEVWRDVPGYEGRYQISNLGNFKSLAYSFTDSIGRVMHRPERIHDPIPNNTGYYCVKLNMGGKSVSWSRHLLVWDVFGNEKRKPGYHIDHINNIKTDNRIANLQQITIRENSTKDKKNRTGTHCVQMWRGKYRVIVCFNRKAYNLGCFIAKEEAAATYEKAIRQISDGTFRKNLHNKSSKYKGVSWDAFANKWVAKYKNRNLGRFSSEEDANGAYQSFRNKAQKPEN